MLKASLKWKVLVEGEPKSKSPGVEDSSFTSPTGQQVINSPPKDTRPLGRKNSKKAIYEERVDTKQHEEVLRSLDELKGLLREQNLQAKRKADGILEFNRQFRCFAMAQGVVITSSESASALPAVSQATLNLTHECPDQSVQLSEEGFVRRTPPPGESEIGCGVLGCVMPGRYGFSWENLFCEFHMSEGMISFLQI